jgi:HEAT repeat protein
LNQLRSEDAEARNTARRKLKEAGPLARPELERGVSDPDLNMSATCKELLRVLATMEKLSPALRTGLPGVEERLAVGGNAEWTQAFLEARAWDPKTRNHHCLDLRKTDYEILVAPALRGADPRQALQICVHLMNGGPIPSAVPELVKLLRSGETSQLAVVVLSGLPFPETLEALVPLLKEASVETRSRTAETMGALYLPEAAPHLVTLLSDPNDFVKGAAIRSLGNLRYQPAGEAIRECLGIESQRAWVVEALGKVGCKRAAGEIALHLDSRSPVVRGYAAMSLAQLGFREAIPRIAKLLIQNPDDGERHDVALALGSLGQLGAKDMLPLIRPYATDQEGNVGVRSNAITALAALEDRESASILVPSLRHQDIGVSEGARHALRRMKATEQIPQIIALLGGRTGLAIPTLADLGDRQAVPHILPFLKDNSSRTRAVAGDALCRLGSELGAEALLEEHGVTLAMISLNALRAPSVWEQFTKNMLRENAEGSIFQVVESIARHLGMTLHISATYREKVLADKPLNRISPPDYWGQPRPLDMLVWISAIAEGDFIVDAQQIRWVSREESWAFWRAWLDGRKKQPGK